MKHGRLRDKGPSILRLRDGLGTSLDSGTGGAGGSSHPGCGRLGPGSGRRRGRCRRSPRSPGRPRAQDQDAGDESVEQAGEEERDDVEDEQVGHVVGEVVASRHLEVAHLDLRPVSELAPAAAAHETHPPR